MKNAVINIVAGLGLISFITMFCDFVLLNYVSERKMVRGISHKRIFLKLHLTLQIAEKKYEVVSKHGVLSGLLTMMSVANTATAAPTQVYRQFCQAQAQLILSFKYNSVFTVHISTLIYSFFC